MTTPESAGSSPLSRRHFLKGSGTLIASTAVSGFPFVLTARAQPDDPIRVGLIGCGGRGTGAVLNLLGASTKVVYPSSGYHTEDVVEGAAVRNRNVRVVALADVFPDRLKTCRDQLLNLAEPIAVPPELCFTGFDGYQKLLAIPEINYVILATPPFFRPTHLMAAVQAGKHVFMEKPAAVDGPGVRLVMEASELARQKGLGIAAGTQRRHQPDYIETIRRLQDGMIGGILEARAYWNGGVIWVVDRQEGWTDMEWQLRNWNYFTWLGGDHIVEQHVHNLDIINWILGAHPIRAIGLGGRQARETPQHGHIYDHFAVEYEYPGGVRMFGQCRQINDCDNKVEEAVLGSLGTSNCKDWIKVQGAQGLWRAARTQPPVNPYEQTHQDLIASIQAGNPINEGRAMAESTLTGILGRESAYSGRTLEWDDVLNSTRRLGPAVCEFGPLPFPEVAIPGKYKFS